MEQEKPIRILLIEDNADFAKLVKLYLAKYGETKFKVEWRDNGRDGIEQAVAPNASYDVILMDYFLPGLNGLEVTKTLHAKNVSTPVIFLTVNKDVNLAVEVMKLGVEDYLVKEEVSTPILPKTILGVVEKRKLQGEMEMLEIRKKRIEAMQEMIVGITTEVSAPLGGMKDIIENLLKDGGHENAGKYLAIIKENIDRIQLKVEKLKNLKEDKTVQYIKDIRMIDLS
ncbi:MAG: response regulator [Bacteroidota bacterium]